MILRIGAIALNTFREANRNKILYVLLLFALALIVFALALGPMSLHEELRITRDLGLAGIALFSVLIAIFVGVNLVYKELDRKTVFSLIPKPIHRFELILGKFAGMVLTLFVQVAIMSAVLFFVLLIQSIGLDKPIADVINGTVVRAILLLFVEVVVITAVAVLFSSFSTPLLSGAFSLGIFVVGRFMPELREVIGKLHNPVGRGILYSATRLFPDLNLYYVSGSMVDGQYVSVHGNYVDWGYVAAATSYGLFYVACALVLAILLFSRRDFV